MTAGRQRPPTTNVGEPFSTSPSSAAFVAVTLVDRHPGQPQQQDGGRLLRGRPLVHRRRRTARRSRATTCRRHRSSASAARSRSTATTGSSTRSDSSWPGSSPCCSSPSCCATRASSRWPTCCRSGSSNARCGSPRRPRPSPCASSTCSRRWRAPADSSSLLLGVNDRVGQSVVIAVVGAHHDHLRAHRRHEGHDLGADHQGGPAHRRRRRHDGLGARALRVQPVGPARRRGAKRRAKAC